MKVQVLVASINQRDYSLLDKMNIKSDAIIGNQCDRNSVENFIHNGNNITYLNFNEKGVGLNRNNSLMRANADICLFADDDMVYFDNYVETVINAFERYPKADVIIFNINGRDGKKIKTEKVKKINYFNYLKYGTARIAIKLKPIKDNAIYFNQCFGGGTEHCHGEDNLFLTSCLKNNLNIYAVPDIIASLNEDSVSTWNNVTNQKYIIDQGILYHTISKKWWVVLCLQDAIRKHKKYNCSIKEAFLIMIGKRKNK